MRIPAVVFGITLLVPLDAAAQLCRGFHEGTPIGVIESSEQTELSGLAASWRNEELYWTHNDSGDSARLFGIAATGETLTTVTLDGVTAIDWEDMAVGPCDPQLETACVWIADIGDNAEERSSVQLLRFPEPVVASDETFVPSSQIDAIEFAYPDGPTDAETLLVHPLSGRAFVVEKTAGDPHRVWEVDPTSPGSIATEVASVEVNEGNFGGFITAGDFGPTGKEMTLRTYQAVYTFCGANADEILASQPTRTLAYDLVQAEAIAYAHDGVTLITTTEVRNQNPAEIIEMRPLVSDPFDTDAGAQAADMGEAPDTGGSGEPLLDAAGRDSDIDLAEGGGCCATSGAGGEGSLFWLVLVLGLSRRIVWPRKPTRAA